MRKKFSSLSSTPAPNHHLLCVWKRVKDTKQRSFKLEVKIASALLNCFLPDTSVSDLFALKWWVFCSQSREFYYNNSVVQCLHYTGTIKRQGLMDTDSLEVNLSFLSLCPTPPPNQENYLRFTRFIHAFHFLRLLRCPVQHPPSSLLPSLMGMELEGAYKHFMVWCMQLNTSLGLTCNLGCKC